MLEHRLGLKVEPRPIRLRLGLELTGLGLGLDPLDSDLHLDSY